jgi:hypothetical protein
MSRRVIFALELTLLTACQSADEEDWFRIKPDVASIADSSSIRKHLTAFPKCTHVAVVDQLFVKRCADYSPLACSEYLDLFPKRDNAAYVKAKQEEWDKRGLADLQSLRAITKELKTAARSRARSNKRTKATIRFTREDYPGAICAQSTQFLGRYCPSARSVIPADSRCKAVAELQGVTRDAIGNSPCYARPYDRSIPDYQLSGTQEFTSRLNRTAKLIEEVRRLPDL